MDCVVIAPSKIPQQSGSRIKNDRRDCLSLARLHRAGELTPVYVSTEEDRGLKGFSTSSRRCNLFGSYSETATGCILASTRYYFLRENKMDKGSF